MADDFELEATVVNQNQKQFALVDQRGLNDQEMDYNRVCERLRNCNDYKSMNEIIT